MLHTLLPTSEKKILKHEYHVRLLIVLCLMLSISFVIGCITLLPTFTSITVEKSAVQYKYQSLDVEKNQNNISKIENIVNFDEVLLDQLASVSVETRMSNFVTEIVGVKNDVLLTSLSLEKTSTTTLIINIQGIAPNRNALLSFKSRLESLTNEGKVDLPISQLAESKNINFSLQVTHSL